MFQENPSKNESQIPVELIELYDDLSEFTNYCFFVCDALDGVLSTGLALEPETCLSREERVFTVYK